MMDPLRIFLFSGLVFHKLVWELLKRRNPQPGAAPNKPEKSGFKSLVKLAKVFVLIFLCIQTLFLTILPISADDQLLRIIGTGIYLTGLAMAVIGRIQLGINWANIEDYQVIKDQAMVEGGLYRLIRHPIYTGDMLLLLGLELALNSWLFLLVIPLMVYIDRQAKSEERILSQAFPGYAAYQQRSKKFFPYIY